MSTPALYQVCARETDAVAKLLAAVVEVNWHRHAAACAGWEVTLHVTDDGQLSVNVYRADSWPSAASEAEAEA
jgi:uncharacterized protein (DUF2126 family)